jgi:hypothetical protein
MATAPTRELKIGTIIDKALAVLERCAVPALIFLVTLTAVNCAIDYFTWDAAPLSQLGVTPLRVVIGVFFSYNLLKVMVDRTGLRSRGDADVFLTYFGLTILYGLAIAVGLILLVIPALFLMARWSLAQPLVVARGDGVMKAFGQSWERTSGNDFPIIISVLVLVMIPTAIAIAAGVMFEKGDVIGMVVAQVAQSVGSLMGLCMGVALYGIIIGMPEPAAAAE